MDAIDASDEEVKSLSQSILVRYGIDFTCYEPKSLRRRVVRILSIFHFNSVHELWLKMLKDRDFIYTFMNEISVGMTSMFRDPVLWKSVRAILQNRTSPDELSIWHAGCSTGEEVYTMGIVLTETKQKSKAKAFASDINQDALETARKGIYHKIKMVENENNYKQYNPFGNFGQYYTHVHDTRDATMQPALIDHVNFSYHNLINDTAKGSFDIIFCRNVMIYFDNPAKTKLLDKFYEVLKPGGLFIIGFYDSMTHLMDQDKFTELDQGAKIFIKTPSTGRTSFSLANQNISAKV
jgi:chemotaxis protein methyltransferase CheR